MKWGLNIHFSPPTFHIISFQSLTIYEIQFWSQTLFFLFFGPWFERWKREREREREGSIFDGRERISIETDSATETSDFGFNEFLLMSKV